MKTEQLVMFEVKFKTLDGKEVNPYTLNAVQFRRLIMGVIQELQDNDEFVGSVNI